MSQIVKVSDLQGRGVDANLVGYLEASGIETLTEIQVRALDAGVADGASMIISAPTSSGKTLIGEIAVFSALKSNTRAIYLVSHKALADQKYQDFSARIGEQALKPMASVGLSTGDREEGDIDAQILIATYEKALGLVVSGQLNLEKTIVVADELQIIGEEGRGPQIEALCAIFRQRALKQFVALTATVQNPEDLAKWLNCKLVTSAQRNVPLHQEIWVTDRVLSATFGQTEISEISPKPKKPTDMARVVLGLIEQGLAPVLVFTETRKEAAMWADSFGQLRQRSAEGIKLAEQLDLFSEPTESSESLKNNAERRVAFHSADLSPQERQVIEEGISKSKFDVCFATSTLGAGVNFPLRSIVFPKLTYQWREPPGSRISLSDYRNMSGRAGRLGIHPDGYSILLPKNNVELEHARALILPENEHVSSKLVSLSLRRTLLTLVVSQLASNIAETMSFFTNTLYWQQVLQSDKEKLAQLEQRSRNAFEWLIKNGLLSGDLGSLHATPLGNVAAYSGLLPTTAVAFAQMLVKIGVDLENDFSKCVPGLIYAACASDEFRSQRPSRFLPYTTKKMPEAIAFWANKYLPVDLDRSDMRLAQCALAILLYADGMPERKIAFQTGVSSGYVHRLAVDVAWVLDGLHKLSWVSETKCSQTVGNKIDMLRRQVRWGAPAEALDVMRIAERHSVPGFGRQRAMTLLDQGIKTIDDLLGTAIEKLTDLLRNGPRARALLDAVSNTTGHSPARLSIVHARVGKALGYGPLVDACNLEVGTKYEDAIVKLLRAEGAWSVKALDDGIRKNVPDILLELGGKEILIECKTCTKKPPLIGKEDAWAVLQKASDFGASMRRVTLGKPMFDETCKIKILASQDITLVEHSAFIEGILRVLAGTLSPKDFINWLAESGLAEIGRLGGKPTSSF